MSPSQFRSSFAGKYQGRACGEHHAGKREIATAETRILHIIG
jgi:hypothetical protein